MKKIEDLLKDVNVEELLEYIEECEKEMEQSNEEE